MDKISTEEINNDTNNIDELSVLKILELINKEDLKVITSIKNQLKNIALVIKNIEEKFKKGGRLFYVGSGTSGRLGVLDASEMLPTFNSKDEIIGIIAGGDMALRNPIELAEDNEELAKNDLEKYLLKSSDTVIAIGASGRTPYSIGALKFAKDVGAYAVGLSMSNNSEFKKYATDTIEIYSGPEVIAGSTRMKAGTATKLILNMISTTLMIRKGKTYGNLMIDVRISNKKLFYRAINIVKTISGEKDTKKIESILNETKDVRVTVAMLLLNVDAKKAKEILQSSNNLKELIAQNIKIKETSNG